MSGYNHEKAGICTLCGSECYAQDICNVCATDPIPIEGCSRCDCDLYRDDHVIVVYEGDLVGDSGDYLERKDFRGIYCESCFKKMEESHEKKG